MEAALWTPERGGPAMGEECHRGGVESKVSKCRVRGGWLCGNKETPFFQAGDTFCSFSITGSRGH